MCSVECEHLGLFISPLSGELARNARNRPLPRAKCATAYGLLGPEQIGG